jgi:tetratricopeptide (TPR) repeat protein
MPDPGDLEAGAQRPINLNATITDSGTAAGQGRGPRLFAGLEPRDMRHLAKSIALATIIASTGGAAAEEWYGCDRSEPDLKVAGCTKLIETPGIHPVRLAGAYVRRAYGYDKLGQYQRAIRDLDEAIRILPQYAAAESASATGLVPDATKYFAVAYNNRAEAYLRLGKPSQGLSDAEKAVQFVPREPHFYATRGEAKQALGDQLGAIRDHDTAMTRGGARWIKHYQCGLRLARLYPGPLDGTLRPDLHAALRVCVDKGSSCDPVSTDPECPDPVG